MTTILGFLKANKKLSVGCLALAVGSMLCYKLYNDIYNAGYNKRTSEYNEAYNLEVEKQQKQYEQKLATTLSIIQTENQAALDRQVAKTEVAIKTEKVIQYVDKIVVKTECSDLAADVVWMLSESTTTINNEAKRATKAAYKF